MAYIAGYIGADVRVFGDKFAYGIRITQYFAGIYAPPFIIGVLSIYFLTILGRSSYN